MTGVAQHPPVGFLSDMDQASETTDAPSPAHSWIIGNPEGAFPVLSCPVG